MIPKRSARPPVERAAQSSLPPRKPRLVYAREDAAGSEKAAGGPVRLLVVEDDYFVATEIEAALEDAGFSVVGVAPSAEEALACAAKEKPTLAIMDIRLSGKGDGVEAATTLFRDQGIRCIFATAHADEQIRARGSHAAPLGWLQKPFTMPALIDAVRKALDKLDADA